MLSTRGRVDTAEYDRFFNQAGYNDGAVGSVRDFYTEASYGKLTLSSVLTVWVQLPKTKPFTGPMVPAAKAT